MTEKLINDTTFSYILFTHVIDCINKYQSNFRILPSFTLHLLPLSTSKGGVPHQGCIYQLPRYILSRGAELQSAADRANSYWDKLERTDRARGQERTRSRSPDRRDLTRIRRSDTRYEEVPTTGDDWRANLQGYSISKLCSHIGTAI